jgi:hypothetical protein
VPVSARLEASTRLRPPATRSERLVRAFDLPLRLRSRTADGFAPERGLVAIGSLDMVVMVDMGGAPVQGGADRSPCTTPDPSLAGRQRSGVRGAASNGRIGAASHESVGPIASTR